ncbi:hypothetical protein EUGRSUZ_A02494 [Eucalyptus grandis]|uniref:Uncharacterized protein n=2 Tax=Eucalyptus grandis TaxID=71139 RepID=A0ACC3M7X4_EUCGR|nr:hypothetical protein EUGRSUZ_A02494 [Eucalyptus grandis]
MQYQLGIFRLKLTSDSEAPSEKVESSLWRKLAIVSTKTQAIASAFSDPIHFFKALVNAYFGAALLETDQLVARVLRNPRRVHTPGRHGHKRLSCSRKKTG